MAFVKSNVPLPMGFFKSIAFPDALVKASTITLKPAF